LLLVHSVLSFTFCESTAHLHETDFSMGCNFLISSPEGKFMVHGPLQSDSLEYSHSALSQNPSTVLSDRPVPGADRSCSFLPAAAIRITLLVKSQGSKGFIS
jgi:hypothetical protein